MHSWKFKPVSMCKDIVWFNQTTAVEAPMEMGGRDIPSII